MNAANADRVGRIKQALTLALSPDELEVIDDSHRHVGHAGARDGKGHFTVRIKAAQFSGLRPLQRHQLVYKALADMMQTEIHALAIVAVAPNELT